MQKGRKPCSVICLRFLERICYSFSFASISNNIRKCRIKKKSLFVTCFFNAFSCLTEPPKLSIWLGENGRQPHVRNVNLAQNPKIRQKRKMKKNRPYPLRNSRTISPDLADRGTSAAPSVVPFYYAMSFSSSFLFLFSTNCRW